LFEVFDYKLLALANAQRSSALDLFFLAATWLGSLWLLVPSCVALFLFCHGRLRAHAWQISSTLLGAALVVLVLKNLFLRARPELFPSLISIPPDAAFPSGHAAQMMSVAVAIWLVVPAGCRLALGLVLLTVSLSVGWSRIYLQVHWPSDVMAGWAIGALTAVLVDLAFRKRAAP
jgi:membrane-associated phospholipid phosphatase